MAECPPLRSDSVSDEILDPVEAYDRIAPVFPRLAAARHSYLDAVDRLVISQIPPGGQSLLDVGGWDGSRGRRIANASGLKEVTLLEPSAAARSRCPQGTRIWPERAEELGRLQGSFDVIVCLWNVLGHIFPIGARVEALRQFSRLASPAGNIFVDVNHRYNLRHYGTVPTAVRYVRDRISPGPENGDVTVRWALESGLCVTAGHVFTQGEFRCLCDAAGLGVEKRFVVDYASGKIRRWGCEGNLLYVLRPRR